MKNALIAVITLILLVVVSAVSGLSFNSVVLGTTAICALLGAVIVVRHKLTPVERTLMRYAAKTETSASLQTVYERTVRQLRAREAEMLEDHYDEDHRAFFVQGTRAPRRSYHDQLLTVHATERSSTATPKGGNRSVDVVCQSRSLMAGALYDFGENRRNVDELLGSLTDHETTLDWLSRREQSRVFDELAQRYAAS